MLLRSAGRDIQTEVSFFFSSFFLFFSPRPSQHPLSHLSCCVWQLVLGYRRTGASLGSDAATRDPPISCSLTFSKQSMLPGHRVGANVIAFLEQLPELSLILWQPWGDFQGRCHHEEVTPSLLCRGTSPVSRPGHRQLC